MFRIMYLWVFFNSLIGIAVYFSYIGNTGATNVLNVFYVINCFGILASFFAADELIKSTAKSYIKMPDIWVVFVGTIEIAWVSFYAYQGWFWWCGISVLSYISMIELNKEVKKYIKNQKELE